ncbi:hypothetical protein M8C21_024653 [Ambrosia artemisiifolia]|uniref:RRM domain-containing protein n=1 Tax=Ambrosia artemisiifolia TaxID=4212 RepID=A0AAD5CPW8_AMBAR|nr:hypothetical protein M8C21_024653 [Ambrosia artemisiifolia]
MEETPTVGEIKNPVTTKKKIRVVKKIVKKKIIKKVTSPNSRVNVNVNNINDSVEIEKVNVGVESVKEVEVSGMEEDQVYNKLEDCDWMKIEVPDSDQSNGVELQGSDCNNRVELQDSERNNGVDLQDSDMNRVELQDSDVNRVELQDVDQNRSALVDSSQNKIEVQDGDRNLVELENNDQNGSALVDGSQNRIETQDGDQKLVELRDSDQIRNILQNNDQNGSASVESAQNRSELEDNDRNQVELTDREHEANSMNVEEHEGEEGVKELINSGRDGLRSQEGSSESKVPKGKMVASRLYTKQMKKIFIHGLVQETKEEDIRKVFEEVGEVVEVKLIANLKTGKRRGCGFITFASADLANLALTKYQNVEICGRPCKTSAIEGIDTILLDNIDKKWNKEHVVELLQKIGIKKIDEVVVVPDPNNAALNCGFAFLEFETKKDAQMAYNKLRNEKGKHSYLKVSWASQFVDPVEEEINNIKSVYAENIPLSWDEKEVSDHFKMFGEIESIALAKNLRTAKRNDFAFINYKTCEAAHSCIEALTCKKSASNNGSKGRLKVSLAKSIQKVKPIRTVSGSAVTEVSHAYQNANRSRQSQNQYQNAYQSRQSKNQYQNAYQSRQSQQNSSNLGVYELPQKPKIITGKHEDSRKDSASSTTAELVQLLREQASWKQGGPSSTAGHHQPLFGGNKPYTEVGSKSAYHHDPREYHQSHLQIPSVTQHRPIANVTSFPRYDQQHVHYTSGSLNFSKPDPRYIQTRDQPTYPGSSTMYRKMH